MGIPAHVQALRAKVGNDLLILPGVCAIVFNSAGQLLLNRRRDNGCWALIGGIADPGEEPADAVIREVYEETAVKVTPERITGVYNTPRFTLPNRDQVQYVVTTFRCRANDDAPRVNDDESLEVRYFDLNQLPSMRPDLLTRIEHALREGPAYFTPPCIKPANRLSSG